MLPDKDGPVVIIAPVDVKDAVPCTVVTEDPEPDSVVEDEFV